MPRVRYLAGAFALWVAMTVPSYAAVLTVTYHLTADTFHLNGVNSGTKPFDPIDAFFTLSFDSSANLAATPLGSNLGILSGFGSNINYAYRTADDILTIGQNVGPNFAAYPNGAFGIYVQDALTNPNISTFIITSVSGKEQFQGFGAITLVPQTTTRDVPEPASWAMFVAGFGIVGAGLRRRGTASALLEAA